MKLYKNRKPRIDDEASLEGFKQRSFVEAVYLVNKAQKSPEGLGQARDYLRVNHDRDFEVRQSYPRGGFYNAHHTIQDPD